ncbi:MAG: type II toxin-antitoxin system VapC family toxin [Leptolyngbyaceae cyanobacterium]
MNGWLLDTNIISELRKTNCHPAVKAWSEQQLPQSFYLSTVILAEIRFGIEQVQDEGFRQELAEWLDATLRPWFSVCEAYPLANRLLEISEDVILVWRRMVEKGRKQGHTFSQPDLFIAAIASVHNLCVTTRNVRNFEKTEVSVFNPFLYVGS